MNDYYPFDFKPLPYRYDALVPFIDARTLFFHHDKHYRTYVNNLNNILENYPQFQSLSLEELLKNYDKLPSEISTKVRNNAGGVYNHELYFNLMGPNNINIPKGEILNKIIHTYGGFDNFESEFKKAALDVFGSGYTFLVLQNNNLDIINRANQDNPLYDSQFPLLTIDVWEHAYYLMYQNRRDRYINCWFSIINWDSVNSRYLKAINGF